jgi:hypothetical protein
MKNRLNYTKLLRKIFRCCNAENRRVDKPCAAISRKQATPVFGYDEGLHPSLVCMSPFQGFVVNPTHTFHHIPPGIF